MIGGDGDRFRRLMESSDAGERYVDRGIISKAFEALIDHYRSGRPLPSAEPSSGSPSSTGPDSKPKSSGKRGRPKNQPAPEPTKESVGFVAD